MKAAVIGSAGYAGGELLRLLLDHPEISEVEAISRSQKDQLVSTIHEDMFATDLSFRESLNGADIVFLCGEHGQSRALWQEHDLDRKAGVVIDLAQDHRDGSENFVYGLTEVFAESIRGSQKVANPGCFATAIQLGLAPLASAGWLRSEVHITGITGSTGAGQKLQKTSHFSTRQQNLSVYKAFDHQHLSEIERTLSALLGTKHALAPLHFVPMRGPFTRGILVSMVTACEAGETDILSAYRNFYQGEKSKFVHITQDEVNLKTVVNTNHLRLQINKHGGLLHVVACLDNLLKGASGQAVQNMNLMLGWPVDTGLRLKALAF